MEYLNIRPNGRYVDGTLGLGGHAAAILKNLNEEGRLLGIDVDPGNLAMAENLLQPFEDRTITRRTNFRGLQKVLDQIGWLEMDGVLLDLGISSRQLDEADRGFSFSKPGPLDMRLDPSLPQTALSLLQTIDENHLIAMFQNFGEARHARRLARAILADVAEGRLKTTADLAAVCVRVLGRSGGIHPATRVFLALRSMVNDELGALEEAVTKIPERLSAGGRFVVITFHSLEDRLVKSAFRRLASNGTSGKAYRVPTKKPVVPTEDEIRENPRSRSAKLRVLERIA